MEIKVDDAAVKDAFERLLKAGQDLTPVMSTIAGIMHDDVEGNFAAQGRPQWTPLAPSTLRKRRQAGKDAKILQDSGSLAASITPSWGRDYALIGTNKVYGPIQHYGGTIQRAPHSRQVRLATDAKGNLTRRGKNGKLATFAKDRNKRARTSWHKVGPYEIRIPARPFLKLSPDGLAKVRLAPLEHLRQAIDGG